MRVWVESTQLPREGLYMVSHVMVVEIAKDKTSQSIYYVRIIDHEVPLRASEQKVSSSLLIKISQVCQVHYYCTAL